MDDRYPYLRPSTVATILAFAGLPLYIHVPRYYGSEMGINLATLGTILLLARGIDSFQDPFIGRMADRWPLHRERWVLIGGALLCTGFALLFTPPGWGNPVLRLGAGLMAAFTGFSALQIALYDHGLAQAKALGGDHNQVALWREVGGLLGICLAAVTPSVLEPLLGGHLTYTGYAVVFSMMTLFVLMNMRRRWMASTYSSRTLSGPWEALSALGVKPLLAFSFVNGLPTAVTSTLVLFFVEDILRAPAHGGPILLVFFIAAAGAAPFWVRLARKIGRRGTLAIGMTLSIPIFTGAYALDAGDIIPFYIIAAASGAALGADMTLTPAMLAARIREGGGQIFSLWTFLQKSTLALAAGIVLPLLAFAGYSPNAPSKEGYQALSIAYALIPCALKIAALPMLLLFVTDEGEEK